MFTILFLVDQIERNLFIVLTTFDVIFSVIIFISIKLEKPNENNVNEEVEMLHT